MCPLGHVTTSTWVFRNSCGRGGREGCLSAVSGVVVAVKHGVPKSEVPPKRPPCLPTGSPDGYGDKSFENQRPLLPPLKSQQAQTTSNFARLYSIVQSRPLPVPLTQAWSLGLALPSEVLAEMTHVASRQKD